MAQKTVNAVSCAIFSGNDVLLIKRAYPPYQHYWTLSGGRCEIGENPENAVVREIGEELGIEIKNPVPVEESYGGANYRLLVFAARFEAGTVIPNDEVADWCWQDVFNWRVFLETPGLKDIVQRAHKMLG